MPLALPDAGAAAADPHLRALRELLSGMGRVLVCYSGGVDSALVLAVAHAVLGAECIGMTAVSPSLAEFERNQAVAIAKEIGARHELVESSEIDDENYQKNLGDRCFYCKSELYRVSTKMQSAWNVNAVLNGTNLDDLGDYRPGLEAAKNAAVRSPLVEAGFHKHDVRRVAQLIGLGVWDKPASACLASRVPHGTRVTRERLARIGGFEEALHNLGLRQVRVRFHALEATVASKESALARVEVAMNEMPAAMAVKDAIVAAGKDAGFVYVTLDLQGYRMGSHNELLVGKSLRVVS